ncbi:MAG: hypothetical protein F6K62_04185 [Sphaerospermopsis sp. SIO1G2]|nr:hypothetical protein [Sphaerospermopsis sp. SIO1G2]
MIMTETTNTGNTGVNREEAKSILQKFLNNENYRVLAVKGKWGVGKTHLVQTFLEEHHKNYYLYASVFGISSIEHLKARILGNYKDSQDSQPRLESSNSWLTRLKPINSIFEFFNKNSGKLEKTPKLDLLLSEKSSIPVTGTLLAIGGNLLLELLFDVKIRENSIICIDDIERKSKLPLDEILGFVEYLNQDFKCKIILIYNEDNLVADERNKKFLDDYREKVIDREVKLDPTVDENLDFIFKDHPNIDVIKEVLKKTETNNIRVIRKTKWLIDEILPLMNNWEDSLRHQIIRNSIIIAVAKLDTDFCTRLSIDCVDAKPIDTILPISYTAQKSYDKYRDEDEDEDEETTNKRFMFQIKITQELGYINLKKIDELISHLVDTPLSDYVELEFKEKGNILNEREKKNQVMKKLNELADTLYRFKYWNSFADNEQDIINGIITFLENNYLDLSIGEFEKIERFTSIFGLDISKYEKALLEKILADIFKLDDFYNLKDIQNKLNKYPDLQASFENKTKEYYQKLDITTAVKNLSNDYIYYYSMSTESQLDIEFLKSRTVNEYCQWLEKGDPDLSTMVRFLQSAEYQPTSENLTQAIRKLAERSNLNKIRAKYLYNIDIDIPN